MSCEYYRQQAASVRRLAQEAMMPIETAWPMSRFSTGNWRKALKRATTIPNRGAKRKIAAAPG
jgi:secreted Zn-dependent insulinase-like peptidase